MKTYVSSFWIEVVDNLQQANTTTLPSMVMISCIVMQYTNYMYITYIIIIFMLTIVEASAYYSHSPSTETQMSSHNAHIVYDIEKNINCDSCFVKGVQGSWCDVDMIREEGKVQHFIPYQSNILGTVALWLLKCPSKIHHRVIYASSVMQ